MEVVRGGTGGGAALLQVVMHVETDREKEGRGGNERKGHEKEINKGLHMTKGNIANP